MIRLKGNSATEVEPALATTWEPNADSSSWTFQLRPNVKCTAATPSGGAAVKTASTRTIKIALGTKLILGSFITDPDKQIVVVDPATVRFDLGRSVPHFELVVAAEWGTGIASPRVFTDPASAGKDQGHTWLSSHAAGTGPYVL